MACNNHTLAKQNTYLLPPARQRRPLQSTAQGTGLPGLPAAAHLQTHLCHLSLHTHKTGGKHDKTTLRRGRCKSHQGTTGEEKGLERSGREGVQEDRTQPKGGRGREKGKDRGNGARTQQMGQRAARGKGKLGAGQVKTEQRGRWPGSARGRARQAAQRGPHLPPPGPAAAAAPSPPGRPRPCPPRRAPESAAQPEPPRRRRPSAAPRKAPGRSAPGRRGLDRAATAPAHRPGSWRKAPRPARRLPLLPATGRGGATAAARPAPAAPPAVPQTSGPTRNSANERLFGTVRNKCTD